MAHLGCDMAPIMLAAKILKILLEKCSHGDDAIGHAFDFAKPLFVELRTVQNL